MLVEPSVSELLKVCNDRYELVAITSKRARQLASGAPQLTKSKERSKVTLATWEVAEGEVREVKEDEEEGMVE